MWTRPPNAWSAASSWIDGQDPIRAGATPNRLNILNQQYGSMAGPSVVVSFDASDLVLGAATKQDPRLVIRNLVRGDDILSDRITLLFEVDHGIHILDRLRDELRERYDAAIDVLWDDPDRWRARVTYRRVDSLLAHPIYGAAPLLAGAIERGVLHFEDGLSIQRFDLRTTPGDLEDILDTIRDRAREAGVACMVRTTSFDEDVMAWSPLLDRSNRPPGTDDDPS